MRMKMDSLLYLHEINRVHGGEKRFEIHPFLLKYVRIYNWQARQKQLTIQLQGACYAKVSYNSDAIGAVVQGLLDNLVKYSPAGSVASIAFEESQTSVKVKFTSLGPRIEADETSQIFMPKYRARAARKAEAEGQGIGLASVKQISDALGLDVRIEQDTVQHDKYLARYLTSFSITLQVSR
jgi:signal transduction histidine kinase